MLAPTTAMVKKDLELQDKKQVNLLNDYSIKGLEIDVSGGMVG